LRTLPRSVIVALALVIVALVAFTLYTQYSGSPSGGPWTPTFAYPLTAGGVSGVVGQSCVDSAGYVYCIGGQDANNDPTSSVYYAPASSSGVGNWTLSANPYPSPIVFQSCASASGYVYCVGGTHDSSGDDTAASYYATLSPAGVGAWVAGTPYPVPTDALSCTTAVGDIYCVGGENETTGTNATTTISLSDWYAPVSSSGIGAWNRGGDYPTNHYFPSCSGLGSYVYCVGGEDAQDNPQNSTYYAYVTPSGMGPWAAAPDYPIQTIAESCVTSYSSVYCIGGLQSGGTSTAAVYYADVTSAGLGPWQAAPSYPLGVATDCVADSGFLYCVGGYSSNSGASGDSYYALLNATASSSSSK
jgi:hypothetical protein